MYIKSLSSYSDYIPLVSSATSLVVLFQKYSILAQTGPQDYQESHYYRHIQSESSVRSIVLLIPVLGNVVVGVCDLATRYSDKYSVLAAVREDGAALEHASERLQNDKEVVLVAAREDGAALQYASKELKNDKEVVLAAVREDGAALQYASRELKNDKEVVLAAVSENGAALEHASEWLKENKEVVLVAVSENGAALEHASELLKNNKEVVLVAAREDGAALQYVSRDLKYVLLNRKESEWVAHVLAAFRENGEEFEHAVRRFDRLLWSSLYIS